VPFNLNQYDPAQIAAAAAVATAVLAIVLLLALMSARARLREGEDERQRLQALAVKAKEILAAAPDGLFLWDHTLGAITCSRRLAVLLNLEAGTNARYDDIRACFAGESLAKLERAVSALLGRGTPFDMSVSAGERTIQAIGVRAETETGDPMADMVWMRDVSGTADSGETAAADPRANTSGLDDRHLTALLDAMPLPIWLRDSNLALAFTNQAAGNQIEDRIELAELARSGGAPSTERRLLDNGGSPRLMDITEVPLGIRGDGNTKARGGTLGFAIDRSENEIMDGQRQREQATDNAVLESLRTAVAIFDAERNLEFFNPAYAELWDLDADWLRTRPDISEILEKLRDTRRLPEVADFREFKARQLAQFAVLTEPVDEMMHLPDGHTVRVVSAPHGDGGLVFTYEDISERLDLERSMKSLGAVQRETLDKLHEGVAVFGGDGRLKLFNPVFAGLWSLDEADLEDEPHLSDVIDHTRPLVPPPENEDAWSDAAWSVRKDLVTARLLARAPKTGRIALTNGTFIDYANVPLPDGAVLLSYMDVTDSTQVENALRQRAEAYQEADRLKSEFIASVAHETRTPLSTVIGFADMLGQEYFGELNPRQAEYARGILDTSRGLMAVIADILDLASIEAGRLELNRDSVDIHGLLVGALNLVQERSRHKDLRVEFNCPTDIGWMTADDKRLKQVVFHLLSNAITFTPPRGTIRLEARRDGDDIIIAVSDTGVGFPQAERDRLFRPFEKGDAADGADGPGLGLTLVRNFVELHGGQVDVKSAAGRGTTVACRLSAQGAEISE
jgi:signal transduction histidine kinase